MLSAIGTTIGRRRQALEMQPRSVIPGRQRWEIGVLLGQPRVAELLEAELGESPGVGVVHANPVTGRLLICHDTALNRAEIGRLVGQAVTQAIRQLRTLAGAHRRPERSLLPSRVPRQYRSGRPVPLIGIGGAAVALVVGSKLIGRSPLGRLGVVLVATAVVVRRAWRKSRLSQRLSTVSLRSTRHPVLRIVGSHRKQFYLASLLSILVQALDMAPSLLIGWIFIVLVTGESALLTLLGVAGAANQLWFLTGVTTLAAIIIAILSFISGVLWRDLSRSVQHEWRTAMYAHVQRAKIRHLEGERTTRLARVLIDDIGQLGRFFETWADYLLKLGTSFIILIPLFLYFAPSITWIAFLPVPIVAWLSFFYQERAIPDLAINNENISRLNSQLINNLEASATVKSFGAEEYEINRIHGLSEAYRQSNRLTDTRSAAYTPLVRVSANVSLAGILALGSIEVLDGMLSFAVFSALIGAPQLILWKLPMLGDSVDQYQRTVAALGRILDLENLPVESSENGRQLAAARVNGEIVLDKVTFAYPDRPPVLRELSLRIAAGKTTGIVGVTGTGKTTIAKLLLRLDDVGAGRVLLDDHDIRELKLPELRKVISFVAQDAFLFDGTVGDNITYGSFDADQQRITRAAQIAKADDFIQALPAQYNTMIGERGITLSGGQKQRISLARAIVKNAPIVILDEATSAVDNETEAAIQQALAEFAQDRTMVIIAHRLSTIRHADWIYVLGAGGVVAEEGTHDQLLARDGVYASMWQLQIGEITA